ncbi:hypothetical protein Plhal703r1_c42g0141611 [Plasmopara halstedii]
MCLVASECRPQSFPLTKYKKELKAKQTNNVVKWLLNMHETLSGPKRAESLGSCLSMYLVDY